eukprot:SAG31_NODE_4843_length_2910_cov_2.040911_6_plen_104_part_00
MRTIKIDEEAAGEVDARVNTALGASLSTGRDANRSSTRVGTPLLPDGYFSRFDLRPRDPTLRRVVELLNSLVAPLFSALPVAFSSETLVLLQFAQMYSRRLCV